MNLDADADPNQIDYTCRLDFLSSLLMPALVDNVRTIVPLVQYGNGIDPENNLAGRTRIAGIAIDENTPFGSNDDGQNAQPGVYAMRRVDGTAPNEPFRKTAAQVTGA